MQNKFIVPLNPFFNFKFIATTYDPGKAISLEGNESGPSEWYYSDNNSSSDRVEIHNFDEKETNSYQLDAQLAVLSGNLFRRLLGNTQPEYYAGKTFHPEHPRNYLRVCNAVEGFTPWQNCIKVTKQGIAIFNSFYPWNVPSIIPLKGMTAMLVAGLFLAEEDWNNTNFGLIKGHEHIIRIDPGLSFNDSFLNNNPEEIYHKLSNLLFNFVYNLEEGYFQEFQDLFKTQNIGDDLYPSINHLFCSKNELFETLYKIINLTVDDYWEEVRKSSTSQDQEFWENFLTAFKNRIKCFKHAALKFKGFQEYFNQMQGILNTPTPMRDCYQEVPLVSGVYPSIYSQGTNFLFHFVPGPSINELWRYPHIAHPQIPTPKLSENQQAESPFQFSSNSLLGLFNTRAIAPNNTISSDYLPQNHSSVLR